MRYKIVDAYGRVWGTTGSAEAATELVRELNEKYPDEHYKWIDAKENPSGTLH